MTWLSGNDYECDLDGSFAKVNCKIGETRCGCVDKFNNWMGDYYDDSINKDMFNCQCARDSINNPDTGAVG